MAPFVLDHIGFRFLASCLCSYPCKTNALALSSMRLSNLSVPIVSEETVACHSLCLFRVTDASVRNFLRNIGVGLLVASYYAAGCLGRDILLRYSLTDSANIHCISQRKQYRPETSPANGSQENHHPFSAYCKIFISVSVIYNSFLMNSSCLRFNHLDRHLFVFHRCCNSNTPRSPPSLSLVLVPIREIN
jgi:hypothetical protein